MATFSQNDISLLYVGKSSTALSTAGINGLNDGEIGLFTPSGTRINAGNAVAGMDFMFVQGRGAETPIVGKKISVASVKSARSLVPVVATEQVDYIGYNGAGGAIDPIINNLYYARLNMDETITSNHGGLYVKHGVYQSGAVATTQEEIADGLAVSLYTNFKREASQSITFERLNSNAGVAATSVVDVVNGSTAVNATVPANFVIGTNDIIRFGTAVTDPVYRILSIVGTVLTLDVPYQGATAQFLTNTTESIVAGAGNDAGVKLTGVAKKFVVNKFKYRKALWDLTLDDMGTTTYTAAAKADEGRGTLEQSAELEYFYRGNNGEYFHMGEPNIFARITDIASEAYATVHISVEEQGGVTTQNKRSINFVLLLPGAAVATRATVTTVGAGAFFKAGVNTLLTELDTILGTSLAPSLT